MFDHVFYNDNKLKVLRILEIPQEQDLAPGRAGDTNQKSNMVCYLPNSVFPSNHLRLEVEFEMNSKKVKVEKESA
jgi:mRNA deadenylase 3'-5' endonuclease subunit Ccr4